MLLAAVLLTATLAIQGALGHRRGDSIFLQPRVCLNFDLLCNVTDYETRSYNQTTCIALREDPVFGFRVGFQSLLQYIRGANSQGLSFRMTSQFVLAHNADGSQLLYWLLPADLQENPPLPLVDENVFLTNLSQMFVYAKTVRVTFRELDAERRLFNSSLAKNNLDYNQSVSYVAFCKRERGPSRRRERNAEEQLDVELFDAEEEEENSGHFSLSLPLTQHGQNQPGKGRNKNNPKGRGLRNRCFDLWFQSNGFPMCPVS